MPVTSARRGRCVTTASWPGVLPHGKRSRIGHVPPFTDGLRAAFGRTASRAGCRIAARVCENIAYRSRVALASSAAPQAAASPCVPFVELHRRSPRPQTELPRAESDIGRSRSSQTTSGEMVPNMEGRRDVAGVAAGSAEIKQPASLRVSSRRIARHHGDIAASHQYVKLVQRSHLEDARVSAADSGALPGVTRAPDWSKTASSIHHQ